VISTDGTVVDNDVPRPQGHSIPLFNFKTSLAAIFAFLLSFGLWLIIDVHIIGHDVLFNKKDQECKDVGDSDEEQR